jgi:hypothetical protein
MNALATIDLSRLAKVCGLFSSDHVGERAEAARRADALVRAAGLTWPQLLGTEHDCAPKFEKSRRRDFRLSPGQILAHHGDALTGWEKGFLTTLIRRLGWSVRQTEIFREIQDRVAGMRT